jgi:hypothetical protein
VLDGSRDGGCARLDDRRRCELVRTRMGLGVGEYLGVDDLAWLCPANGNGGAVLQTAAAWRLRTEARSDRGRSDTGRLYGAARQHCRPGQPFRVRRVAAWPLTGSPHMSANFKYQKTRKFPPLQEKLDTR